MHCEAAGAPFRGRADLNWDYASRAALSIGYTRAERERLADAISVEEPDVTTLRVRLPVEPDGVLLVALAANGLTTELLDCPRAVALQLDLIVPRGTADTHLGLEPGALVYEHNGHACRVAVDGTVAQREHRIVLRRAPTALTLDLEDGVAG